LDRPDSELQCIKLPEVCRLLDVPTRSLRRWIANGKFPAGFRVGRERRWPKYVVKEWIERKLETKNVD